MHETLSAQEMESDENRFTQDELINALLHALDLDEDDNSILTARQLSEQTGMGVERVRDRLRPLIADGRVRVEKKAIVDIVGRRTTTYGYRWIK